MLPGIRFLFAAILLSASILIFGLGAAALLRAAHEEVANIPARRVMAEPILMPQPEVSAPTLAMLRVEPDRPSDTPPVAAWLAEPVAESAPVPAVEPETLAALTPDDTTLAPSTAQPETAVKPEVAEASGTGATEAAAPAVPAEPKTPTEALLAVLDAAPPASDAAPTAIGSIAAPATTEADTSATKTAALGDPAAMTGNTAETNKATEQRDRAELRRKERAERAKERRRQAARRARLAAKQAALQQNNPSSQSSLFPLPASPPGRR